VAIVVVFVQNLHPHRETVRGQGPENRIPEDGTYRPKEIPLVANVIANIFTGTAECAHFE
jgi:hypothetical protein